jgi:hypothetical protein
MDKQEGIKLPAISFGTIVEIGVGLAILGIAFAAIAATDVAAAGSLLYWSVLVLLVAIAALANSRLHGGRSVMDYRAALPVLFHWLAVLVVIHLLFVLVSTGRMANADIGLTCGFILALGAVVDGIHGNWRMIVLGLALGLLTVGMAVVEQYLWVLFGVAILAIAVLLVGGRLTRQKKPGANAAS